MSYTPTNWQTGDTITAEKLNKMEGGVENASTPFVVTCIPTEQDFSGTMDKTVAEIDAAYQLGRRIVFRMVLSATDTLETVCTAVYHYSNETYPSFSGFILTESPFDAMVYAYTGTTSDGDKYTYSTTIYPLTPMG